MNTQKVCVRNAACPYPYRTYAKLAGRDSEIAVISIALAIHSFDPTKDAIFDSAEYKIV